MTTWNSCTHRWSHGALIHYPGDAGKVQNDSNAAKLAIARAKIK